MILLLSILVFFFFNDTATTEIYTLSLHDALPISATVVEYHQLLEQLWNEIKQLPRRQRVALLCNLKNQQGVNVITLFPATGVATFGQLADALEISVLDFETLWARLPLDDLSLGKYLGITRQQVINLRRNARDRLMRRMKALEEAPSR